MILFSIIICKNGFSQTNDTIEVERSEKGKISYINLMPKEGRTINSSIAFLQNLLQANSSNSFRVIYQETDELGYDHQKFQQYYNETKVYDKQYWVHAKNNLIVSANGDFETINLSSVTPILNETQALNKALDFVNATIYNWQIPSMEAFIKQIYNDSNKSFYPVGELVISKDYLKGSNSYKLSWKFSISTATPDNDQLIFIDANNGDIINTIAERNDGNINCTADTKYSNTRTITGDNYSGSLVRLKEIRNGVNIVTLNLAHNTNPNNASYIINTNSNWTQTNWSYFNQDQPALDAHWAAEKVIDYWKNVHNRNSIDGKGLQVLNYVHFDNYLENAFWSPTLNSIFYGDGKVIFRPLVSIDVCAHELAHGICQFTCALNYTAGSESSALNEGLSDIWGATIEKWADPNSSTKQTWLIGEEITLVSPGYLRSMSNPKTGAFYPSADCYGSITWYNQTDAHYRSGVLNKWYYLVCNGGIGTNDLGNFYNVGSINMDDAAKIVYRGEKLYLTSTSGYFAARNAMIQSARDIFGDNTCQVIAVTNAWYAVGVGSAYTGTTNLQIGGNNPVCSSESFSISNITPSSTVNWTWIMSSSNPPATINTSNNTVTVTRNNNANGSAILTATINNYCGLSPITLSKSIDIGLPQVPQFPSVMALNGPVIYDDASPNNFTVCYGAYATIYVQMPYTPLATYYWSNYYGNNCNIILNSGGSLWFKFNQPFQSAVFDLYAHNTCGSIKLTTYTFNSNNCNYQNLPQNPCNRYKISESALFTKTMHVEVKNQSKLAPQLLPPCDQYNKLNLRSLSTDSITTFRLYDGEGNIVTEIRGINLQQTDINLFNYPNGVYNVEVVGEDGYSEFYNYNLTQYNNEYLAEDIVTNNLDLSNSTNPDNRLYVLKQNLYNQLMNNSTLIQGSSVLQQFVDSCAGNNIGFMYNMQQFLNAGRLSDISTLIQNWQTVYSIDFNFKSYLNYYIQYATNQAFNSDDTTNLYNLGLLCPLTEGAVIFDARNLYMTITNNLNAFDGACGSTIGARSVRGINDHIIYQKVSPSDSLSIYPNPTNGIVCMKVPIKEKGMKLIKLTNSLGKTINQMKTNENIISFEIKEGRGVYFVEVLNLVNNKRDTRKIIVE